jgi:hypothetical protein
VARSPPRSVSRPVRSGYFHIDLAEVHTEEGKLYLFVAPRRRRRPTRTRRASKLAFARLEEKANRVTSTAFLEALIDLVPFRI